MQFTVVLAAYSCYIVELDTQGLKFSSGSEVLSHWLCCIRLAVQGLIRFCSEATKAAQRVL